MEARHLLQNNSSGMCKLDKIRLQSKKKKKKKKKNYYYLFTIVTKTKRRDKTTTRLRVMYMYEHGQGVGKSYERAFEYYEQANKLYMCSTLFRKCLKAQYNLGCTVCGTCVREQSNKTWEESSWTRGRVSHCTTSKNEELKLTSKKVFNVSDYDATHFLRDQTKPNDKTI